MQYKLLALGSDFYSSLLKGNNQARSMIQASEDIAIPLTVIGELIGGFHYGDRFDKNYKDLKAMLSRPSCRMLIPSFETADIYGQIYSKLKKQGKMVPTNDLWIAALTLEYDATLATYDKHFKHIDNLKLASISVT